MGANKTLIIIPTYNEAENITSLVNKIFSYTDLPHILFIDDNSIDGSKDKITDAIKSYPDKVHLISRPKKLGLASAYITGFKWALEQNYDVIMEMDADFSHNPKFLPDFFETIKTHDAVIGSRYIKNGGTKNWGLLRRVISKGGSFYARTILGLPYYDLTGGFNAWKKSILNSLDLNQIKSDGYTFQIELKYKAHKAGFKIKEIPIVFEDRRVGQSKMSSKIVLEAIFKVWMIK